MTVNVDSFYKENKDILLAGSKRILELEKLDPYGSVSDRAFYEMLKDLGSNPKDLADEKDRKGYEAYLASFS